MRKEAVPRVCACNIYTRVCVYGQLSVRVLSAVKTYISHRRRTFNYDFLYADTPYILAIETFEQFCSYLFGRHPLSYHCAETLAPQSDHA